MLQVGVLRRDAVATARGLVRELGSVLVAFSGGVDSTLLLKLALGELGEHAVAALANSPAFPEREQQAARELAWQLGAELVEVQTRELELAAYRRNGHDRCFHCKEELFATLEPIQAERGLAHLAYGANADDLGDHRPGHGSATRRGVRFPLLEAGLSKAEIRMAARELGLPNWNKPAFACLSSRIPSGTEVTSARLEQVAAGEAVLVARGFRQVRVRHLGPLARVEVGSDEVDRLLGMEAEVAAELQAVGFASVEVDRDGYATGKLSRGGRSPQP